MEKYGINDMKRIDEVKGKVMFQIEAGEMTLAQFYAMIESHNNQGKTDVRMADNKKLTPADPEVCSDKPKEAEKPNTNTAEPSDAMTAPVPEAISEEVEGTVPRDAARKVRLEGLLAQLAKIKDAIHGAKEEDDVHNAVNRLAQFLDENEHTPDVESFVPNLRGAVRGFRTHDITRNTLEEMIQVLMDHLREKITEIERERKVKADKLRRLFRQLADHAEEIIDIVDLSEILG